MAIACRILLAALLCWVHGGAIGRGLDAEQASQILTKEIKFSNFDDVHLGVKGECPVWVDMGSSLMSCSRLDVLYRGVYTSGLLISSEGGINELTIYHVGHESGGQPLSRLSDVSPKVIGKDAVWLINRILLSHSDVLILFMPGMGFAPSGPWFSKETKQLHGMMVKHNVFSLLDFEGDSAAAYFIAHVKGFLDQYGASYKRISMLGRDGGGWVATIAAAFDHRVQCSVSVFGTLPLKLRLPVEGDERNDLGDFEQHGLLLFKKLDYLDLYALATYPQRRHGLILNQKDDCCFSGEVKGPLMWEAFQEKYPGLTNFMWFNLPIRIMTDHMNMGKTVFAAMRKVCPAHWKGAE